MNRKTEKLFDAITLLREDLVEEAQNYVFRRKRSGWRTFGSLAACLILVVSLGLLSLPRGCGAAGGSDNTSSAPMETMPGATTDSSGRPDGVPPSSGAPSGDLPPTQGEQPLQFTAQVLEVLEDGLLVEPFDRSLSELGPVLVSTAGLEEMPAFYPGDAVTVSCVEISLEDGDAAAQGVTGVWLVEPESP